MLVACVVEIFWLPILVSKHETLYSESLLSVVYEPSFSQFALTSNSVDFLTCAEIARSDFGGSFTAKGFDLK